MTTRVFSSILPSDRPEFSDTYRRDTESDSDENTEEKP